jgi:hypothetical protein
MLFLTQQECVEWCNRHNYPTIPAGHVGTPWIDSDAVLWQTIGARLPRFSGRKVALSRTSIRSMNAPHQLLIWIRYWDIWTSISHLPLMLRLRQALGESRDLGEAPGCVVKSSEFDDSLSIVALSVLFAWDCVILSSRGDALFFASHDEFWIFKARDTIPLDHFQTFIEESDV